MILSKGVYILVLESDATLSPSLNRRLNIGCQLPVKEVYTIQVSRTTESQLTLNLPTNIRRSYDIIPWELARLDLLDTFVCVWMESC